MGENKIEYLISEVLDWKNEWDAKKCDDRFMHIYATSSPNEMPEDCPELGLHFINRMRDKYSVKIK